MTVRIVSLERLRKLGEIKGWFELPKRYNTPNHICIFFTKLHTLGDVYDNPEIYREWLSEQICSRKSNIRDMIRNYLDRYVSGRGIEFIILVPEWNPQENKSAKILARFLETHGAEL